MYVVVVVIVYLLVGFVWVVTDFWLPFHRRPSYARRATGLQTLGVIMIWPLRVVSGLRFAWERRKARQQQEKDVLERNAEEHK